MEDEDLVVHGDIGDHTWLVFSIIRRNLEVEAAASSFAGSAAFPARVAPLQRRVPTVAASVVTRCF
jgi:hypothetical protein